MEQPVRPQDISRETTETVTTGPDGSTSRSITERRTIGTADVALICASLLCLVIFGLSLAIESWREAVEGALPALVGVLTLAVGGTTAAKVLPKARKKE